jgi:aryl-alcohol dehydrogenase-like predicted oxidoreductase
MSFNPAPRDDPNFVNRFGASRKHLFYAVDESLKRLDLDYIDLVSYRNGILRNMCWFFYFP